MKWLILLVLFIGDDPINGKMRPGGETEAECRAIEADVRKEAATLGADVWVKCVEIDRPKKPDALPPPKPTDGDGVSLDGKRRGGNS